MSEHSDQAALFHWAALYERYYPELMALHAIPNGGLRNGKVASDMAEEGQKSGVLDLDLPVSRMGYHGLRIEMKFGKNTLTEEQLCWATLLHELGHCVRVCYSWQDAAVCLEQYLLGNEPL